MLTKTPININFSQGLNLKSDPKQVTLGQFTSLQNSIFDKAGLLQKRNGFGPLSPLPNTTFQYVTTLNGGLVAIGNSLASYSEAASTWIDKGVLQLVNLSTIPLVRNSFNQSTCDAVVAANGLVCTAYIDIEASGNVPKYAVIDSQTGQAVIVPTVLPANSGTPNSTPRVFLLGGYFVIAYGTSTNHIQYIAVSTTSPSSVVGPIDLLPGGTTYSPASTISWDALVFDNYLYVAWNTTAGGQNIKMAVLNQLLNLTSSAVNIGSGQACSMISLAVDTTTSLIYLFYYDLSLTTAYVASVVTSSGTVILNLSPTIVSPVTGLTIDNIALTANNNELALYGEVYNTYPWGPQSNFLSSVPVAISGTGGTTATVGSATVILRSVGLGSKAFTIAGVDYMLAVFGSSLQPTVFLIDGDGEIISRFAYQNGVGYLTKGLPGVTVTGEEVQIPYLYKDFIAASAATTPASTTTQTSPVYSQTGINLATLTLVPSSITSASIGGTLNISGGMLWQYDGVTVAEQGFNVYPDDINVTTADSGSNNYFYYQVVYEWTDNNGNVNRSAPSIPVSIQTNATSITSAVNNTINIPNLRLTYKTNVKISVYRWSTSQQIYYEITNPQSPPVISDYLIPPYDYTVINDTATDQSILGNPILYTTGGVVEDIPGPATNLISLFDDRIWMVDAEDTNLLWYSKQVIESTTVEMSDLFTLYAAPTISAQGSTGPITALSPMDDKLIIFKKDAIYYINGTGPDNTGSNNNYSPVTFISSVVGCANQNSIVFTPTGLMFQSDKGIWLLGRDLSTNYIGAPVETLTSSALVETALGIPGTNQVRFTMDSGITLLYDYYFAQWGTFVGIPGISSTLYEGLHTYINNLGLVFQETPNEYVDNEAPVLMQFTTGWGNLAGLQGFERFYFLYLLGQYISPFLLNLSIAYNYNPTPVQQIQISPVDNYTGVFGSDSLYGGSTPFGGVNTQVFTARVYPQVMKCQSFQISVQELYDNSFGVSPGAGLTMSGVNLIVGAKKGTRTQQASKSFG